jgi:hypothetical protein
MLVLLMGGIFVVHRRDGMIYIPSFMTIGPGVQVILRYCLNNLRGCGVGITDGGDL